MLYTPKKGPYAGKAFASYFAYRTQRSRDKGFVSYHEERSLAPRLFEELRRRLDRAKRGEY